MSIKIEVWGQDACFTRPEMKTERVSYDIITPSAARGLIESVYYHPGLRWVIDRIYVLRPIRFANLRRNEVKEKILSGNALQCGIVDEVEFHVAPKLLTGRNSRSVVAGADPLKLAEAINLEKLQVKRAGCDLIISGKVKFED